LLEAELEAVGIRLNQSFPNVSFKIKKAGGISFNATVKLTKIDQKMVQNILHDYSKQIHIFSETIDIYVFFRNI
jgi:ribosome-interacting GTPase 1